MATVESPTLTTTINQQFFIEPQGGPKHPKDYLENFPETLYGSLQGSLLETSNLGAILYAILGPSGIGTLRQNYLRARLAVEDNGLRTTELDALYAEPFSFARLAVETYEQDTMGLLTNAHWEQIQASDASYKNRAINYLKAVRAGGTLLGITLAAKSGLDRACEVIENYRALYDKYSDDPLGLPYLGVTKSTEEIIILPRQELPKSDEQIITIKPNPIGDPIKGLFKLALPMGANGFEGTLNNTVTNFLPYNCTFDELRAALEGLPVIGPGNVIVSGGPFPGNPLRVRFTGQLADRSIPDLLITKNSLEDVEEAGVGMEIITTQAGFSADGDISAIPTENWYFAQVAMDNIKPVTTIMSPGKTPSLTKRQPPNTTAADSEFVEVLRYVTGNRTIEWPPFDSTHWIESGVEHEAPVLKDGQKAHYANWHNLVAAVAYTETELPDEHVGVFTHGLYSFLNIYTDPQRQFSALDAIKNPPESVALQGEGLVGGIYPIDSGRNVNMDGTNPPSDFTPFWSSVERPEGIDYLEIDLGSVQAVNSIQFHITNKPYDIDLAYDLLDSVSEHNFKPVTFTNPQEAESVLSVGHVIVLEEPWKAVELSFANSIGGQIFTRFIRLGFTRRLGGSPFTTEAGQIPYSIEVKNLRIGRIVSG